MGHTYGEPDEIELTPLGLKLNGSGTSSASVAGAPGNCRYGNATYWLSRARASTTSGSHDPDPTPRPPPSPSPSPSPSPRPSPGPPHPRPRPSPPPPPPPPPARPEVILRSRLNESECLAYDPSPHGHVQQSGSSNSERRWAVPFFIFCFGSCACGALHGVCAARARASARKQTESGCPALTKC